MAGQVEFMQAIHELERIGETNGNKLSMEEIRNFFSDMKLDEQQFDFVCKYFETRNIIIENRVAKEEEEEFEEIEIKEDPLDKEMVDIYIKEAEKTTSLRSDQENQIAQKLIVGDDNARNLLIESNLKFAIEIAKKYQGKGLQLSDLIQESNIGLMVAVNDFEPTLHGSFHEYVQKMITEHIESALEEYNHSTRSAMKIASRVNELNRIATELAKEYEREAKPNEIAERMGITEEEVRELMKVSLDAIAVLDHNKMK